MGFTRCSICLLVLCLVSGQQRLSAQNESRIFGRTTDKDTGMPLVGVNVFVANTTLGSATDTNGYFDISSVSPGQYELVASIIGFEATSKSIHVDASVAVEVNFELKPAVYELNEVTITGEFQEEWNDQFQRFSELFIGTGSNAATCTIINRYDLNFLEDQYVLLASSSTPLVINNAALGYQLTYILQHFSYDKRTFLISYQGTAHFKEIDSSTPEQQQRWIQNRRQAYAGSFLHFVRSIASSKARENGFLSYVRPSLEISRLPTSNHIYGDEINMDSLVTPGPLPFERTIRFQGYLQVTYVNEKAPARFFLDAGALRHSTGPELQHSILKLQDRSVVVNEIGYLNDAY